MVLGKRIRSVLALRELFDVWKFAALPMYRRALIWSIMREHVDLWKFVF